jgi:hypothetical protein
MLLKDFYGNPSPSGRKDHSWLQRSEIVRKALETFWTRTREYYSKAIGKINPSLEDIQADLEILSANTSPEYIAAVQAERDDILASIVCTNMPTIEPSQSQWGHVETTESLGTEAKVKAKTRPGQPADAEKAADSSVDKEAADSSIAQKDEILPKLPVKKRALDIFAIMFPASGEEAAKSVDWNAFVHAMSDAGFSARNGGGSAVVFENENNSKKGQNGKIVFHKPHPVTKIDPVMFHFMGKRLKKRFGWHRDLFFCS